MNILLLDSYYIDSHKKWAENLKKYSKHTIHIISQSPVHWKWKMHSSALEFSNQINDLENQPDLILATDMIDISVMKANLKCKIPIILYFHENQVTYPYSSIDTDVINKRENHYGFINFTSALIADKVLFNSQFHKNTFLENLPKFLEQFPKNNLKERVKEISIKSDVISIGLDLKRYLKLEKQDEEGPVSILWNHRWEYDKNPKSFYELLLELERNKVDFTINCIGQTFRKSPEEFKLIGKKFQKQLKYFGWVDKEDYLKVLSKSDVLPVFSNHEFFGISVVEAIASGVIPFLPNRLVYSEHIPTKLQSEFLFQDEFTLIDKIRKAKSISKETRDKLRNFQEKYQIEMVIDKYDEIFESMQS